MITLKPIARRRYILRHSLFALLLFVCATAVHAKDKLSSSFNTLAGKELETLTEQNVRGIMGTPGKIEKKTHKTTWVYFNGRTKVEVEWEGLPGMAKKIHFEVVNGGKTPAIDYRLPDKLRDGETTLSQAVRILGIPVQADMKEKSQELHYAYADKNMRLFFREHILADFTIY
jgi:hypothetical protein